VGMENFSHERVSYSFKEGEIYAKKRLKK